jgi:DNA polymerase-3 subunit delta
MHALEWLRRFDREPVRPVYAVSGDDAFLIRESLDAIARAAFPQTDGTASLTRYSGPDAGLAEVLDEVTTLPFLSPRRLVIVTEADTFVTRYRTDLEDYVQKPCGSGILVLQVKTWLATARLTRLVDELGLAIQCSASREGVLLSWLIELAQARYGIHLETDAAHLLLELVGADAGILASELQKLDVFVAELKRVERDDVLKLVRAGRVESIWRTVDAATTGQASAALVHLDALLGAGEHPVGLLAAASVNLLKIHHAAHLRAAHVNFDEACRVAGLPAFAAEKTRKQHAHLGPSRADELPSLLLQTDLDLKGGSALDPRLVLERLMVGLSMPRRD